MKKTMILLLTPFVLIAQSYMSKIEPYESYTLYAKASGTINYLDKNDETKVVDKVLIKQDDALERDKLSLLKEQLRFYEEKLALFEKNYKKFLNISGKSEYDKDEKYYDVLDLKITISNLKSSIAELEDTILKKSLHVKTLYVKEFKVSRGDYVSVGGELATLYDTSKSKIIVYVSKEDYEDIENKKVYIDGKESIAKLEKVDITVDETYVSAHKITLVSNEVNFGKVVQVEFKK